jgi:DNA mismatch repair protein PMS2
LTNLFEKQDQTVPHSQRDTARPLSFKPLMVSREPHKAEDVEFRFAKDIPGKSTDGSQDASDDEASLNSVQVDMENKKATCLIENFVGRGTRERVQMISNNSESGKPSDAMSKDKQKLVNKLGRIRDGLLQMPALDDDTQDGSDCMLDDIPRPIHDFNHRIAAQEPPVEQGLLTTEKRSLHSSPAKIQTEANAPSGVIQDAFDRMRPKRTTAEVATITIGSKTTTAIIGSSASKRRRICQTPVDESVSESAGDEPSTQLFGSNMRLFAAPGSQPSHSIHRKSDVLHSPQWPNHGTRNLSQREQSIENDTLEMAKDHYAAAGTGLDNTSAVVRDEPLMALESASDDSGSDGEFLNEERKKSREDAKVAELIHQAEEKLATPSEDSIKRAQKLLRRSGHKDSTTQLLQVIRCSIDRIEMQIQKVEELVHRSRRAESRIEPDAFTEDDSAEERLSLTVCKEDFSRMQIVGQFNLGFILAFRPRKATPSGCAITSDDELFIIDQHASDEKFNFERLQSSTIVQNQPLVKPYTLDLTAIEEEIIIESNDILLKNGFVITIDTSGDEPVGRRCKLLSLPMSREVTFDTADLEELIALLADSPSLPSNTRGFLSNSPTKSANCSIIRPSKVRRLFAMRACRSSVMIGKSLSKAQMERLVRHMGQIDKPWNCPHGRPTMRHVLGLGSWEGWMEGMGDQGAGGTRPKEVDWKGWTERMKMAQGGEGGQYGKGDKDVERKEAEDDGAADEAEEGDEGDENGDKYDETEDEAGEADKNEDADDDLEEDEEVTMEN